jgi:hypothetical protein
MASEVAHHLGQVLPLRATQKIQTMFAALTPSSRLEDAAGLALLTAAAASRGYLAAARRQTHRAL